MGDHLTLSEFISHLKERIASIEERLSGSYRQLYEEKNAEAEKMLREIDLKFRDIFYRCLKRHQSEGIAFDGAMEDCLGGDFDLAIERIRWLIDVAEETSQGISFLPSYIF